MKLLIVDTFYGPYLERLYAGGVLASKPWSEQHRAHFAGGFGTSDAYSHGLGLLGVPAIEIVANSVGLQRAWAQEHRPELLQFQDVGQQLLAILEAQIRWFEATVLYVQDINWLPAAFLQHVKPLVELVVGQNACPLAANLDLSPYDLLLTSLPHYVGKFRAMGANAAYFPIGFDERLLQRHNTHGPRPHPLTFVGGLGGYHNKGTQMLETIAQALPLQVWGYGGQQLPEGSSLKQRWQGEAWAEDMYGVLANSQITINRHIDIAENYANNMRLYEATGMGACLVTDQKCNLPTLLEPGWEVMTYANEIEAISIIKELQENPIESRKIAIRAQKRVLREHTYKQRTEELHSILSNYQHYNKPKPSPLGCVATLITQGSRAEFERTARLTKYIPLKNRHFVITTDQTSNSSSLTGLKRWHAKTIAEIEIALDCLKPGTIQSGNLEIFSKSQKAAITGFTNQYKNRVYVTAKLPNVNRSEQIRLKPSDKMQAEKDYIMLVGSKSYKNLNLNPLVDYFSNVARFNLSMPFMNNGTNSAPLILNNHLYDHLVTNKISKEEFIEHYREICTVEHLDLFYDYFHEKKPSTLFYPTDLNLISNYLNSINYPAERFTSFPRVGINAMINILAKDKLKPVLLGFSIKEENRTSTYSTAHRKINETLHSSRQEYELLRWLNQKGLVDTTLCLLEDNDKLQLDTSQNHKATDTMIELLDKIYEVKAI